MKIKLIYILGVSYSGSTLLSFLIGGHPQIHNLGEIKGLFSLNSFSEKNCLCGQRLAECEFWSEYTNLSYQIIDDKSFVGKNFENLQILLGKKIKINSRSNAPDSQFLYNIKKSLSKKGQDILFLLDSSKSLWRLTHLLECKEVEVNIVYLKRAISPNVSSFVKHKKGFIQGILIYKLQHFLIKKFFKNNPQIPHLDINYEIFCKNPDLHMEKLGRFLDLDMNNYQSNLKKKEFHVAMGNTGSIKQMIEGKIKIKIDSSWKTRLSPFQKKILNWFE